MYALNYYNDVIPPNATMTLADAQRIVFAWRGSFSTSAGSFEQGMATYTKGEVTITAGREGAMLFRWELVDGQEGEWPAEQPRMGSLLRMSRKIWSLDLKQNNKWLFRLDMINNPPGLVADVHTHEGPGIRALLSGSFRCLQPSENGAADCPGDPWWESGIEAVISTPHDTEPSKFLRCMILPPSLAGEGNSGTWHRHKIEAPPDWSIWALFVDEIVSL